ERRHQAFEYQVASLFDLCDALREKPIKVLFAVVLQIEAEPSFYLLHIGTVAGEGLQNFPNDLPIFIRIDAGNFEQQPFGRLGGFQRFASGRKINEDHQLDDAPGEFLLSLSLKQHWNLASKIRKEFLCDGQKFRLDLKQICEVVHDYIGSQQVSPR